MSYLKELVMQDTYEFVKVKYDFRGDADYFWLMKLEANFAREKWGKETLFMNHIMTNDKFKDRFMNYHNDDSSQFIKYLGIWLDQFKHACKKEWYMQENGSFMPDITQLKVLETKIIDIDKWDKNEVVNVFKQVKHAS